jgi:hypothetical protein
VSDDTALRRLSEEFNNIGRQLSDSPTVETALPVLTQTSLRLIPHAECGAISRVRKGQFETVAESAELPLRVDAIQYELQSGPCVDAVLEQTIFRTGDLRNDPRWPEFGKRAADETGVNSMLSFRLFLDEADMLIGLNLYSKQFEAFDERDEVTGSLLATHGAQTVGRAKERERADNLRIAVESNRTIGMAIGIVMSRFVMNQDEAFGLLRIASQRSHRRIAEIAVDVIETGTLEIPGI